MSPTVVSALKLTTCSGEVDWSLDTSAPPTLSSVEKSRTTKPPLVDPEMVKSPVTCARSALLTVPPSV